MISKLEKEKLNDDSSYFDCRKESAAHSRRPGGNPGRASPSAAPKFSERLARRFSGRRAWHVDRSAPLWNRTASRRFRGWHARRRRAEFVVRRESCLYFSEHQRRTTSAHRRP